MTVTRDTRLIDLFDLPEPVWVRCVARRVRTVGALLDCVGPTPDVLTAAYQLFLSWCLWTHNQECRDAAALVAEIAESLPRRRP